ncbi:molybdopterin-guanine dinucleotide biosynthesis protein MobA [Streptomyces sp. SID4982]|nr:molybdopterin-guanine dinucleotide biosynthesis protein MobA [Streptomyces sp. SID4982]
MNRMHEWIAAAKAELGIDLDVDIAELLDMTKVVAHEVARPAAPITSFLVGYAAALRAGGAGTVSEANRKVTELAERWAAERENGAAAL